VKTFARYFAITFGITLGVLAAVLMVAAIAFGGYSLYRADQTRRAAEETSARATVVAVERATATARQATEQATATALRLEGEQRQRSASATAEAIKLAARKCENPIKLVLRPQHKVSDTSTGAGNFFRYDVSGTVTNTCNFDIVFNLDLVGLAENGVSIVASQTVTIGAEIAGGPGQGRSALIRAGTERLFDVYFTTRRTRDIASVTVTPVIVREDDPP
jgi:hypothetical protein